MDSLNLNNSISPISATNGNGNNTQTGASSQMASVLESVGQWCMQTNQTPSPHVSLVAQNDTPSTSHAFPTPVRISQLTGGNVHSVCVQNSQGFPSQDGPKSFSSREEIKQRFMQIFGTKKALFDKNEEKFNCLQVLSFETESIIESLKNEIRLKEVSNDSGAKDDYLNCLKAFHENTIIMQKTQIEMDLVKPQIALLEEDIARKENYVKRLQIFEARIKEAETKLHEYDTQTGQLVIGPLCIKRSRIFNSLTADVHRENSSKEIQLKQKQRRDELSKIGKTIQDFENKYMALKLQIYSSQCELNTLIDELHKEFATEL